MVLYQDAFTIKTKDKINMMQEDWLFRWLSCYIEVIGRILA